jgi:Ala-tRNA(Pro) deacylase
MDSVPVWKLRGVTKPVFAGFEAGCISGSFAGAVSGHSRFRTGKENNMPIPAHICKFLDSQGIAYQAYTHSRAYTAQGIAQAQHLSGKKLAKVVIVIAEDRRLVMAVVSASCRVDLDKLGKLLNTNWIRLATEEEFKGAFPECELGAMPPLGNIYHVDVWMDDSLRAYPTISFNAGTHAETIQMSLADFERVVQPKVASFGVLLH